MLWNVSSGIILWRNVGCNVELHPSNDVINHTPEIWIVIVAFISMCRMNREFLCMLMTPDMCRITHILVFGIWFYSQGSCHLSNRGNQCFVGCICSFHCNHKYESSDWFPGFYDVLFYSESFYIRHYCCLIFMATCNFLLLSSFWYVHL